MDQGSHGDVTRLLLAWSKGEERAVDELMPLVYDELHRLAVNRMRRERGEHTLQPTALVHEAYLRLVDQRRVRWRNRAQFFALAARVMRRVLVDHARERHAAKRGGGRSLLTLDAAGDEAAEPAPSADLLALDDALEALGKLDPRKARVVELRVFGGLKIEETAAVLEVSSTTVITDFQAAKAWLYRQLAEPPAP